MRLIKVDTRSLDYSSYAGVFQGLGFKVWGASPFCDGYV